MANPYTYSVADDMPSGAVNETKLKQEIEDSAIVTPLAGVEIGVEGDALTTEFTGDLSAGDKTILDGDTLGPAGGLLAAHDNTACPRVDNLTVYEDPTSVAVDAPKGSRITYDGRWFRKDDDGSSTNVTEMVAITQAAGAASVGVINLAEKTGDPASIVDGDLWIRDDGEVRFQTGSTIFKLVGVEVV